ncbi:cholecystokinin receptor type A [Eurytemora carolleeae]|uniref:cholecystokinin receptor type A n=1 Tax=Eurytemora carolleeae TaxID=1294199 RepID=UPI000C791674|nr:cholecystokinin receptor type A [Eurytemora carolleeae]|eukprot:XP_023341116.1 cholecystokinin receptor type A-like [Eurytemora affinis]
MYVEENEEDCLNQNNSIVVWKCTEDTSPDAPPIMGSFVATYQMCMIFLFPAMLMTTSYYRVMKTLWRSTQNMPFLTNTSQPTGTETLSCRALAGGKGSGPPATSQRGILKSSQSSSKHRTSHRPEPNQPYNCDGYEPTRANVSSISIQSKVLCSSAGNTEKINQSRKQIIKMLLVIILLFILCWCPRFLLNLVKWYSGLLPSRPDFFLGSPFYYFSTSAKILPVIHAMLNPIIYSLMCRSVRQMIFSCFSPSTQSNSRNVCSVIRRSEAWNDQSFELQEDAGERSQPSFHGTGTTFIRTSDQDLR